VPDDGRLRRIIPRNPSNKLLERELRESYWKNRERRIN
jgi:hypothetical protein